MGSAPTVYEVADLAGVSTASVSRVLAGNDRVREVTRQRVLEAVHELGYIQSGAARDLARNRTSTFALCFPDPGVADEQREASLWYDEVIRGMERAARLAGYMLLIAATHERDESRHARMVSSRCDGMVVVSTPTSEDELRHIARHTPLVVVGPGLRGAGVDHVRVPNEDGAHELTKHLLAAHGVRRPAFVAGPDSPDCDERFAGYSRALAEAGRPVPPAPDAEGDFTTRGGFRAAEELLRHRPDVDALVCVNDQTAVGAVAALRAAGRRVGSDVAVTGFDGVVLAHALDPPLTTVVQPMRALGEQAIELLVRRVAHPGIRTRTVELPAHVRIGGSCGCRPESWVDMSTPADGGNE